MKATLRASGSLNLAVTDVIRKASSSLLQRQSPDGNWEEDFYTGTGFPKVFYLKYHLYRLYFPITALARFRRLLSHNRALAAGH